MAKITRMTIRLSEHERRTDADLAALVLQRDGSAATPWASPIPPFARAQGKRIGSGRGDLVNPFCHLARLEYLGSPSVEIFPPSSIGGAGVVNKK